MMITILIMIISAFNSDGAINYDSQQVTYSVSFNRPTDYDFNTGIMNTNSGTGAPQETFRFQAKSCKNVFSKGRFEQELEGRLLIEYEQNSAVTDAGRAAVNNPGIANGTRPSITAEDINNGWVDANGLLVQSSDVVADASENQEAADPQLLNSPPPAPPSSDADIQPIVTPEENNNVLAGVIDNPDAQLTNRET